eukprot:Skav207235  [mRNA]  locus=scaffold523:57239:69953:+ [translate_table: standard]
MAHEQSRPDRDKYIRVLWYNVRPGMESQFDVSFGSNAQCTAEKDRKSGADTARPYDLTSLMHYGSNAFTKNGLPTIGLTSLGASAGPAQLLASGATTIGQREGMSQSDFEQLVHLYNCQADSMGRYSDCSPVVRGSNMVLILLGVSAVILLCGCAIGAYFVFFRGRNSKGYRGKAPPGLAGGTTIDGTSYAIVFPAAGSTHCSTSSTSAAAAVTSSDLRSGLAWPKAGAMAELALVDLEALLRRGGFNAKEATKAALAARMALQSAGEVRFWGRSTTGRLLLPEYWERPTAVANVACASRAMRPLLAEHGQLHVSGLAQPEVVGHRQLIPMSVRA